MPTQRLIDPPGPSEAYNGWVRVDGGVWLVCCSAASRGEAWDAILAMPKAGRDSEKCVLEAGRHPEKKRK